MGLFDDPYVDPDEAERVVGCEANRALALQAARETITLLKNDGDLLPLDAGPAQDASPSSARTRIAACSAATAARPSTTSRCSRAFARASAIA